MATDPDQPRRPRSPPWALIAAIVLVALVLAWGVVALDGDRFVRFLGLVAVVCVVAWSCRRS